MEQIFCYCKNQAFTSCYFHNFLFICSLSLVKYSFCTVLFFRDLYRIFKIQLVVASTAIKCMLMDAIFDETHVRTFRHRIYKRNLVSSKKKLNLKQQILATVFRFSKGGHYRDSFHGNNKMVPFTNNISHSLP